MSASRKPELAKDDRVLIGKGFFDNLYVSWGLLIAGMTAASIGLWTLSARYHTTQNEIIRAVDEVQSLNDDIQEYYRSTDRRLDELGERIIVLETKMNGN